MPMLTDNPTDQDRYPTPSTAAGATPESAPDDSVRALLDRIASRHGAALSAVLAYGSYLRGKRDTVLDFYVILDNYHSLPIWQQWLAHVLAPNVYFIGVKMPDGRVVRAKYAVLTPTRFQHGNRHDFHSYFWARFAQPCKLLYCRDSDTRAMIIEALASAQHRFAQLMLPLLPEQFDSRDLWQGGLSLTYRCELRSEKPGQAALLYTAHAGYFRDLTAELAADWPNVEPIGSDRYRKPTASTWVRWRTRACWYLREWIGKPLSLARLIKGATTFEDSLQYLLWKIERHSGIRAEPSPRQTRHPLLFAWPLLWRLYRRGAFR